MLYLFTMSIAGTGGKSLPGVGWACRLIAGMEGEGRGLLDTFTSSSTGDITGFFLGGLGGALQASSPLKQTVNNIG